MDNHKIKIKEWELKEGDVWEFDVPVWIKINRIRETANGREYSIAVNKLEKKK